MSNDLSTASTNSTDPTVGDPRVQHIAKVSERSPEDVLAFAQDEAAGNGDSVSEELDTGEEMAELVESLGEI